MNRSFLRVAAPRLLTVKNRLALLNHVLDRVHEGVRDVVLDLEGTEYIDSSGLAMLAQLEREVVRTVGGRLRVCGLCADLRLLLEATGLHRCLELVEPVAEAGEQDAWLAPEDWTVPTVTSLPHHAFAPRALR